MMEKLGKNIRKITLAATIATTPFGSMSASAQGEKSSILDKDKIEAVSKDKEEVLTNKNEAIINELFTKREIVPNSGKVFSDQVDIWYKRYSGRDPEYDRSYLGYKKKMHWPLTTLHQDLEAGWKRLLEGDLKIVYEVTKKEGVPFDLIFLALTESHWQHRATSRVGAGGPWQFMPGTGKGYDLVEYGQRIRRGRHGKRIKQTIIIKDERSNVKKSTEAACRYLKRLYQLSSNSGFKITNGDRWIWAFWAYNRGEGHVFGSKKNGDFYQAEGNPNRYHEFCKIPESLNYAPTVFAVARVSEEIAKKKRD